jgi:hypothetical protein
MGELTGVVTRVDHGAGSRGEGSTTAARAATAPRGEAAGTTIRASRRERR